MWKGPNDMVKKTRITLSNGLPLVIVEIPGSRSLVSTFWTKAGSRLDPEGKAGMAHFLEHLLIKKTKSYPSDKKLALVLENVGAFKNGSTNKDWMNLNITSTSEDIDLTSKILEEMVFNPYIEKHGFNAERKVILQEQARKRSLPDDLAWEIWFKIFFNPGPMSNPVLGDEKSLNSIELNDAARFWEQHFRSASNLLLISGGVGAEKAIKLSEKYFGKHRLASEFSVPTFTYEDSDRVRVEKRILPRTNMLMSFRIPGGAIYKDFYALLVLRGILATGWSSRIYQRLRVKESLIYGTGSTLRRFFDTGAFILTLASSKKKFPKMISILCEEIVKIRERGISEDELTLAKGFIRGTTLSGVETSWDYNEWYSYDELYWPESADSVEGRLEKIKKVTRKEVEAAAKKYLTKGNWHMAVVGETREKDIKVDL